MHVWEWDTNNLFINKSVPNSNIVATSPSFDFAPASTLSGDVGVDDVLDSPASLMSRYRFDTAALVHIGPGRFASFLPSFPTLAHSLFRRLYGKVLGSPQAKEIGRSHPKQRWLDTFTLDVVALDQYRLLY